MAQRRVLLQTSTGNPFSDNKATNYADKRVLDEFCPISQFWSLFNDQHEVILGSRGCGKTIMLRMMRYSMLRKMEDPQAKKLVLQKDYIAFYVPLHLEYIKKLSACDLSMDERIRWFCFFFNCLLAQSILVELPEIIEDICCGDDYAKIKLEYELSQSIGEIWQVQNAENLHQFLRLRDAAAKIFYNADPFNTNSDKLPTLFIHSLGAPLAAISPYICGKLNISPTWLLCVDEAEFLDECYQRCINSAFRSDTSHMAIKMATLPYYYTTQETLDGQIKVMNGQDFKYTVIAMDYSDRDFINVTNTIVRTRMKSTGMGIERLDQFVETLGDDNYLAYYLEEFKNCNIQLSDIHTQILKQLSSHSREHNAKKTQDELKKAVFDKLAPIFYLREVYKNRKGRHIPAWYAGASMVRRVSQGNPRIFIRIMNDLFWKASGQKLPLKLKAQHSTILKFAESFCEETETLEKVGPEAKRNLDHIAKSIHDKTHKGSLTSVGLGFALAKNVDLETHLPWLEKAVAFSRLTVDRDSMVTKISLNSEFELAYLYAVRYWLPMRPKPLSRLTLSGNGDGTYTLKTRGIRGQMSIFSKGIDDYAD